MSIRRLHEQRTLVLVRREDGAVFLGLRPEGALWSVDEGASDASSAVTFTDEEELAFFATHTLGLTEFEAIQTIPTAEGGRASTDDCRRASLKGWPTANEEGETK